MTMHMDYCNIISTTLKSLYQGTWEVEYDKTGDDYIVQEFNGRSGILEGEKLRGNRFSAKGFIEHIVSILGRP